MKLSKDLWNERYENQDTAWDIGHISTPLKEYFEQLENKNIKILIPGCGNAYEAAYPVSYTHLTLPTILRV